jgi:NDP-sugar pyrophosphorylase family protein
MITLATYVPALATLFPEHVNDQPWSITQHAQNIILRKLGALSADYTITNGVAIHKDAQIEEHVIIKGPVIISARCYVASHAYLRAGVFLDEGVIVGPGCEVKSSFIFANSTLAHFNFAGDSLIGSSVNMEAGSVIANHYNERTDKSISVRIGDQTIVTGITKFGALVSDHCKIGANAVLSPGTILPPASIVKRLELIEQVR